MPAPLTSSFFNYFDGAYIINSEERDDRRQDIIQEFRQFRLAGLPKNTQFLTAIKPHHQDNFPSSKTRGRFMNHLGALKAAKSQNWENLLLLEDTVTFTKDLVKNQTQLLHELQINTWDFAYFGHHITTNTPTNFLLYPYTEPGLQAHFLAIHSRIFDHLIDFLETLLERPADHPDGGPMPVCEAYMAFHQHQPRINTLVATRPLGIKRSSQNSMDTPMANRDRYQSCPLATTMINFTSRLNTIDYTLAL